MDLGTLHQLFLDLSRPCSHKTCFPAKLDKIYVPDAQSPDRSHSISSQSSSQRDFRVFPKYIILKLSFKVWSLKKGLFCSVSPVMVGVLVLPKLTWLKHVKLLGEPWFGFSFLIWVSPPAWQPCIVLGIFFIQSFVILFLYIEIIIIFFFSPYFFFDILVQTILWSGNRLYLWVECVTLCDIFIFNNFKNLPGTILLLAL